MCPGRVPPVCGFGPQPGTCRSQPKKTWLGETAEWCSSPSLKNQSIKIVFKMLYNHPLHLFPKDFATPEENSGPIKQSLPFSLPPRSHQPTFYFCGFICLCILDMSYKQNHTKCDLLWLASFTWCSVLKSHPPHSMYQYFIFYFIFVKYT